MKITNVTPGLITIPPNGWGAVEKIIWEIHNNLLRENHQSEIKYLSDVDRDSDIIHIHVANLALEAHRMGIPYYFSMHDHHSVLYGKDSHVFKENYEAIKNSILTFLPARYLVDYFGLPNIIYLPHGVNTSYFTPNEIATIPTHSILCVANNGYANNPTYDRKGFLPAIEVARKLGLPITIVGPSKNNKQFFDEHSVSYDKLTIKYNLTEDELKTEFKNHTIFLHLSELEAGHPNLTLLEAMASGLVVVATLEDGTDIDGICKVSRDVNESVGMITGVIEDYNSVRTRSLDAAKKFDWTIITKELVNHYKFSKESIRKKLIDSYSTYTINPVPVRTPTNKIIYSFSNGPKVEVLGPDNVEYTVKFIDLTQNSNVYTTNMHNNHWAKANQLFYKNWEIQVHSNGRLLDRHIFNTNNKRVLIKFDSAALGDTLAWIPYVEEFRKKHNCTVYCSTFHNNLLISEYPHINFIQPDTGADDRYAIYEIGWFWTESGEVDRSKHPDSFIDQPLQKTASDILGLDYKEIKPNVKGYNYNGQLPPRYFTFSLQSTAQSKYWNYPNGWETLLSLIKEQTGLEGVCIDKHTSFGNGKHMNYMPPRATDKTGLSLEDTIGIIRRGEFHLGISSGLSWLAWALNKPVVMISGFTQPKLEFTENCIRIHNTSVCNGCFTNPEFTFDRGDWEWCPVHKGTNRQFECTKVITPDEVFNKIKESGLI